MKINDKENVYDEDESAWCACACTGPLYNEPYCPCEMRRRGLPLNKTARAEATKRAVEQLNKYIDSQYPAKHR